MLIEITVLCRFWLLWSCLLVRYETLSRRSFGQFWDNYSVMNGTPMIALASVKLIIIRVLLSMTMIVFSLERVASPLLALSKARLDWYSFVWT